MNNSTARPTAIPTATTGKHPPNRFHRRASINDIVDLKRHRRACKICKHPQCDYIELDFVDWRSPAAIARRYGIRDRASIYRHAHAMDLFSLRRQNLALALDNIIERSDEVKITAGAVVRAIHQRARITETGDWIEPERRSVITHLNGSDNAASDGYPPPNPPQPFTQASANVRQSAGPPIPTEDYYRQQILLATQTQTKTESTP